MEASAHIHISEAIEFSCSLEMGKFRKNLIRLDNWITSGRLTLIFYEARHARHAKCSGGVAGPTKKLFRQL